MVFTVSRRGRNNPFVAPQLYFLTRTNSLTAFLLLFFFCFVLFLFFLKSDLPTDNVVLSLLYRGVNDRFISSLVDECFLPSHTFKSNTAQCLFIYRAQFCFSSTRDTSLSDTFLSKAAGWDRAFVPPLPTPFFCIWPACNVHNSSVTSGI